MVSPSDKWMDEYNEALKLVNEINRMVLEAKSFPEKGRETQRHFSTTRRKITILKTRLQILEQKSQHPPATKLISEKAMSRRNEMVEEVRSNVDQMADTLNSFCPNRRDRLPVRDSNSDDVMKKVAELDNHGVIGLQREIIKVQDEDLEKIEESVLCTKHIAITINEELDLQTKLLDTLEDDVATTSSGMQWVRLKLSILNKRSKESRSFVCLALLTIIIPIIFMGALIKNL